MHSASFKFRSPATGVAPAVTAPMRVALTAAVCLATTGCLFQKPRRVYVPPPFNLHSDVPIQRLPDPILEIPPVVETSGLNLPPDSPPRMPDPPAPPKPVTVPPRRPAVAQTPKPIIPVPDAPAPARLGQIFTADQQRDYNRTLDESLERVRIALDTVSKRRVSSEDSKVAELIRSFLKQAQDAREQDLITAVNLATRADLLAKDLLERTR